jgi:hypothetical protein
LLSSRCDACGDSWKRLRRSSLRSWDASVAAAPGAGARQ